MHSASASIPCAAAAPGARLPVTAVLNVGFDLMLQICAYTVQPEGSSCPQADVFYRLWTHQTAEVASLGLGLYRQARGLYNVVLGMLNSGGEHKPRLSLHITSLIAF